MAQTSRKSGVEFVEFLLGFTFYNFVNYKKSKSGCKITTNIWNIQGFCAKSQIYLNILWKILLFAQLCDCNFGGMRSRRSPKLQQIFVCFFMTYAIVLSFFSIDFSLFLSFLRSFFLQNSLSRTNVAQKFVYLRKKLYLCKPCK